VIVITGICESWIALLLTDNTKFLAYLRVLRLLRLARVLKIAHMMLTEDISWAQGQWFQIFVLCVIGFNNRILGLGCNTPDFHFWWVVDDGLLCISIFVLVVCMRVSGCAFFWNRTLELFWQWLALVIVVGAVVELWSMPAFKLVGSSWARR
jgi:hypothetical protein